MNKPHLFPESRTHHDAHCWCKKYQPDPVQSIRIYKDNRIRYGSFLPHKKLKGALRCSNETWEMIKESGSFEKTMMNGVFDE